MKCAKVKNPCKICFKSVNKKSGLQCQGACQKWAHFKCLNFTPGKIQDIKAGIIRISCPCPDCETSEPKEVLTDPPYTCTNTGCPVNKPPICASTECPSNANPIPPFPPPVESSLPTCPKQVPCPRKPSLTNLPRRTPSPPKCPPKKSFSPKQSQSCSKVSNPCPPGKPSCEKRTTSDPQLSSIKLDQKHILSALENLCNTVGQLSTQIRDLMCKMKGVKV